jgi:Flp pilus assembly protein TadG
MPCGLPYCNLSTFLRDERGSQTIEFMLWVPVLMLLLVTVIDAATLYLAHAEMENIARDTARRMVTGDLNGANKADAELAAKNYASWRLSYYDYPHTVDTVWDKDDSMIVNISTKIGDAAIFGTLIGAVLTDTMYAQVTMRGDPSLAFSAGGGGGGGGGSTGGGGGGTGGDPPPGKGKP